MLCGEARPRGARVLRVGRVAHGVGRVARARASRTVARREEGGAGDVGCEDRSPIAGSAALTSPLQPTRRGVVPLVFVCSKVKT